MKLKNIALIIILLLAIIMIVTFIYILSSLKIIDFGSGSGTGISSSVSGDVKEVMAMSDEDAWEALTGGVLSSIPSSKSPDNAAEIEAAVKEQIVDITIPIWGWESSGSMNRVEKEATIQVNEVLAELWQSFFEDLHETDKDFVIVDVGGFRIDGLGVGQIGFKSGHTYGAAVDINPTQNPYGSGYPYSKSEWEALPETHEKYQIIYEGAPIIEIAHKYTLYWGGEWTGSNRDMMHFSFIADGKSRSQRIQDYGND